MAADIIDEQLTNIITNYLSKNSFSDSAKLVSVRDSQRQMGKIRNEKL